MLDQLLLEYGNKLKVIKKYQEGSKTGEGWKKVKSFLDGIEHSLKLLGYEEELEKYISKLNINSNTNINKLKFGVITEDGNKKMCSCGLFSEKKYWEKPYTTVCVVCENVNWIKVKSSKATWKKIKNDIEVHTKDNFIEIIKIDQKYNINWENETLDFKDLSKSILIDVDEREMYLVKGNKRTLAKTSNLKNFLSGVYNGDIMREVVNYYNEKSEYWNIYNTDKTYLSIDLIDMYYYLKYPQLTLINNYFGKRYLSNLDRDINNLNLEETSIHKMFGVSKRVIRFIKDKDIKFDSFTRTKYFISEHGVDNYINANKLFITRNTWYSDRLLERLHLLLSKGYKLKELKSYIDRVNEQQGITDIDTVFTLMYDYIRMSEDMEINFHRYSKSLKLHHDIRARDYEVVISEKETELFHKRYEEKSNLYYKNDKYSIILPDDPVDVAREGQNLNHCVSSYVKRIVKGENLIVFLRDNNNLEKSLVTIELKNNNCIVQARGKSNRNLNIEEKSFIEKWSSAKNLTISYF